MAKGYKRANGTGGVTKLSGRRTRPYLARVCTGSKLSADGTSAYCTYYNVGYYKTRAEAVKALEEFQGLNAKVEVVDYTLEDIYNYYLAHDALRLSQSTRNGDQTAFNHLDILHKTKYRKITIAMVEELIADLTCNSQMQVQHLIGHLDKTARKLDIPVKYISDLITIKSYVKKYDKEPLSESDIEYVWTQIDNDYAKLMLILVYTGWRITELLTIKKIDVDLDGLTMKGGIKTKAGKNRIVPIHRRIVDLIRYFYDLTDEETLIPNNFRSSRTTIRKFNRLGEALDRKITPHECRHTMETRLSNAGVDLIVRNKLMGHKNNNVGDDVYNHVNLSKLRDAVDKLH